MSFQCNVLVKMDSKIPFVVSDNVFKGNIEELSLIEGFLNLSFIEDLLRNDLN